MAQVYCIEVFPLTPLLCNPSFRPDQLLKLLGPGLAKQRQLAIQHRNLMMSEKSHFVGPPANYPTAGPHQYGPTQSDDQGSAYTSEYSTETSDFDATSIAPAFASVLDSDPRQRSYSYPVVKLAFNNSNQVFNTPSPTTQDTNQGRQADSARSPSGTPFQGFAPQAAFGFHPAAYTQSDRIPVHMQPAIHPGLRDSALTAHPPAALSGNPPAPSEATSDWTSRNQPIFNRPSQSHSDADASAHPPSIAGYSTVLQSSGVVSRAPSEPVLPLAGNQTPTRSSLTAQAPTYSQEATELRELAIWDALLSATIGPEMPDNALQAALRTNRKPDNDSQVVQLIHDICKNMTPPEKNVCQVAVNWWRLVDTTQDLVIHAYCSGSELPEYTTFFAHMEQFRPSHELVQTVQTAVQLGLDKSGAIGKFRQKHFHFWFEGAPRCRFSVLWSRLYQFIPLKGTKTLAKSLLRSPKPSGLASRSDTSVPIFTRSQRGVGQPPPNNVTSSGTISSARRYTPTHYSFDRVPKSAGSPLAASDPGVARPDLTKSSGNPPSQSTAPSIVSSDGQLIRGQGAKTPSPAEVARSLEVLRDSKMISGNHDMTTGGVNSAIHLYVDCQRTKAVRSRSRLYAEIVASVSAQQSSHDKWKYEVLSSVARDNQTAEDVRTDAGSAIKVLAAESRWAYTTQMIVFAGNIINTSTEAVETAIENTMADTAAMAIDSTIADESMNAEPNGAPPARS